MADDVLLKFLNKRLINVGGDDDKLEHLKQTAADLASILEETPTKACPFALVAFDPHVPTTDPTVVEVEDALRKRWQTYVNTFSDTPVTVFRAMLLDALISACGRNDTVAAAFVASARNVLPFMEVADEQELWANIVADIERSVEERAEREWATPASISVPDIKFKPPAAGEIRISSKKVNTTSLGQKFMAAAGPHFNSADQGQVETQGNPQWPQDDPASWNFEFGRRTAETVGEAITQAVGGLSVEGIDLPAVTQEMTSVISGHLTTTLQAVSNATAGLQRRTNLLWWKEALFSPSARMSYRDMTSSDAATLMAFDMHQQIPTFSPASVAAFLRETVVSLPTLDPAETSSIRELVENTHDTNVLSQLSTEAANLPRRGAAPFSRSSATQTPYLNSTTPGSEIASASSQTRHSPCPTGRFGYSGSFRPLGPLPKPPRRNAAPRGSGHPGSRPHGRMSPGNMLLVRRRRMRPGLPRPFALSGAQDSTSGEAG